MTEVLWSKVRWRDFLHEGLAQRDAGAVAQASWDLYAGRLRRFFRSEGVSHVDIDDCVMRVIGNLMRQVDDIQQDFERWLMTGAWYEVQTYRAAERRSAERAEQNRQRAEVRTEDPPGPETRLEARQALESFLTRLTPLERAIVRSMLADPRSDEEIIALLNGHFQTTLTMGAFRVRRSRLRRDLNDLLEGL